MRGVRPGVLRLPSLPRQTTDRADGVGESSVSRRFVVVVGPRRVVVRTARLAAEQGSAREDRKGCSPDS